MIWTGLKKASFLLAFIMVSSGSAIGQSDDEFIDAFSGEWKIVDDSYAEAGACQIVLNKEKNDLGLTLQNQSCKMELAELTNWEIIEGQLALKIGGDIVSTLGGNQQRMSGTTAIGAPIILERVEESELVAQIRAARAASGCHYLGFTNNCADDAQLSKPTMAGDGSGARISVLVNLNARVEARDDAAILGVVPANSCIVADICQEASDGVWCRARFGEDLGWLKKVALRQERWPVVTFVNQCSE